MGNSNFIDIDRKNTFKEHDETWFDDKFLCIHCSNVYKSEQSLRNHISMQHTSPIHTFTCNHCEYSCKTYMSSINHLINKHKLVHGFQVARFTNQSEAKKFLEGLLHNGLYSFTKSTGVKKTSEGNVQYYVCNRKRDGVNCLCFIKYQHKDLHIKIVYNNQHNHEAILDKAKIPKSIKNELIVKILNDVEVNKIYRGVTNSSDLTNITKAHAITKNYIRYLKNKFETELKIDNNDLFSTHEILKQNNKTNIKHFIYKEKGERIEGFNEIEKYFIISFQTNNQYNSALQEKSKYVMVDATHSTNIYGYLMITFAVLTRKQRFLPFLTVLADSENEKIISFVLSQFSEKQLIPTTPATLMSDLSPVYVNSWRSVINPDIKWYYCSWHCKTALIKNVPRKEKDEEIKKLIIKKIKCLLKTYEMKQFHKRYTIFMQFIASKSEKYYEYFSKNYDKCLERWAPPYRIDSELNNNMFLESFHGVLKNEFLRLKSRNRLDFLLLMLFEYDNQRHLIYVLSDVSKNMEFAGYREKNAKRKHKKSLTLNKDNFKKRQDRIYYKKYIIVFGSCDGTSDSCKVLCRNCQICKDRYVCNCYSFVIKKELCKHIHVAHSIHGTNPYNNKIKVMKESGQPVSTRPYNMKQVRTNSLFTIDSTTRHNSHTTLIPQSKKSRIIYTLDSHTNELTDQSAKSSNFERDNFLLKPITESSAIEKSIMPCNIQGDENEEKRNGKTVEMNMKLSLIGENLNAVIKQVQEKLLILNDRLINSESLSYVNKINKFVDTMLCFEKSNTVYLRNTLVIDKNMLEKPKKQREKYKKNK